MGATADSSAPSAPRSAPPSGRIRPRVGGEPSFSSPSTEPSSSDPTSLSLSCSVVTASKPYSAQTFPMLSTMPVK